MGCAPAKPKAQHGTKLSCPKPPVFTPPQANSAPAPTMVHEKALEEHAAPPAKKPAAAAEVKEEVVATREEKPKENAEASTMGNKTAPADPAPKPIIADAIPAAPATVSAQPAPIVEEIPKPVDQCVAKEERKAEIAPVPIAPPRPRFSMEKFPYRTEDPELVSEIRKLLDSQDQLAESVANLSGSAKCYYDFAQSLHAFFEEMVSHPDWEPYDKGENWSGHIMTLDGLPCHRSQGRMSTASPAEMFGYLANDKYKTDHNEMLNDIQTIEEYPCNMKLVASHSKGSFIVSAREFLTLIHTTCDPKTGRIEAVSASVEDPRVPVTSQYVRGEMRIMGTRFDLMEDGGVEITSVGQADPKGSIPTTFKNSMAKKQSKKFCLMSEAYTRRFLKK